MAPRRTLQNTSMDLMVGKMVDKVVDCLEVIQEEVYWVVVEDMVVVTEVVTEVETHVYNMRRIYHRLLEVLIFHRYILASGNLYN